MRVPDQGPQLKSSWELVLKDQSVIVSPRHGWWWQAVNRRAILALTHF
jgi:hypothetical protein